MDDIQLNSSSQISRFSMRWGGEAGDGLQSTGNLLQKYFNRLNYYVQGFPGTQSTIRGGHVWQHVEFSSNEMKSFDRPLHLLVALNTETLHVHLRDVINGGFLLYNSDNVQLDDYEDLITKNQVQLIGVPLTTLAREVDLQTPVLANTVAVGAVLNLLNLPLAPYEKTLEKRFEGRDKILSLNENALKKGFSYLENNFELSLELSPSSKEEDDWLVISGNEMIAIGAVASGLKFLAQYPITPASSILTYLSNRAKKLGVVVRQAEDELSAINMIIGASYTGVRAMTASSGPGLSLMAESFGYASMTETPLVIVNAMRGGPSTGIPTKMEQADLNSMVHLSHGEGPRAIFAPRNMQEAFDLTTRAFNIADQFQIPVIILSDFSLSERTQNIAPFDLDVDIKRGKIWKKPTDEFPEYKRYQFTDDGISPRAFPSTPNAEYILVGAEHDEESHSLSGNRCGLPESWELREKMLEKRNRKMELLRAELRGPDKYGPEQADITILCWGSIEGAVEEAITRLNNSATLNYNMLSFSDMFPFPYEKFQSYLEEINQSIMIEVNYTGQFEDLIHRHTNWRPDYRIHPLDGETPTPTSLIKEIQSTLNLEETI